MTRKKKADDVLEKALPPCCGNCGNCYQGEGTLMCYGLPPFLTKHEDEIGWVRGAPVDSDDPPCAFFKQRMHA